MAGIGFQLEKMARSGVGGFAAAAFNGAVVSCGPWILTILAVFLLQLWTAGHSALTDRITVQTIIVYSFSASVVIATPFAMFGIRLVSDLMYSHENGSVAQVLMAMLTWATMVALVIGYVLFGVMAALPAEVALLAIAIVALLTQIAVTGPFLTTTRRHGPILVGYIAGIVAAALVITVLGVGGLIPILLTIAVALALTVVLLLGAVRTEFPVRPAAARSPALEMRPVLHVGAAGIANALAMWIDKWLLWWAPGSTVALGQLRTNPIYDPASFLGLLTLIPGLSLMLFMSETRLERVFSQFTRCCTGTAKLSRIEDARREVAGTIMRHLRLLVALQVVLATTCWVLTADIFRRLGYDPRGIFAFRFTVVGAIFHLLAIYTTIVLSYFDLFGRIVVVWLVFALASAAATLSVWHLGFAGYGWGYLVGAVAGAVIGLALLANATVQLTFLMFVGNNPSIAGKVRYWI